MTMPSTHERMVARLLADAEPVRPLWAPEARLALWLTLQVVAIAAAAMFGLRDDVAVELGRPRLLVEIALCMAAGALAGAVALRAAVPARMSATLTAAFWAVLACALALIVSIDADATSSGSSFVASGIQCVASIVAFAALPWAALFVAVRRGAPLAAPVAGLYAGAAAFLFAAAAVRIACPIDTRLHVLTWHVGTMAIGTALSTVAGARWLARWAG
jgi:hypothetical protein